MPLYEYVCKKCHAEFEALVRGDERPECPQCGEARVERQLSVPAAHVKGAGAVALPTCRPAPPAGGCGAPWCGTGGCGQ